jgi:hypothetical protein
MTHQREYAVVDVRAKSPSRGKILVVVDDEVIAQEIAVELRRRRCQVAVHPAVNKRIFLAEPVPAGAPEVTGM